MKISARLQIGDLSVTQADNKTEEFMKIKLSSVMVDDQDKALKFYTDVLGFVKKTVLFEDTGGNLINLYQVTPGS